MGQNKARGGRLNWSFLTVEGEEGEIAIVEVGEENDNARVSSDGRKSMDGVSFLECLGEEERDEEVEKKLEVTKKRGRDEGGEVKLKGRGWEEREMEVKGEARWVVKTRESRLDEDGKWEDVVVVEERIRCLKTTGSGWKGKG